MTTTPIEFGFLWENFKFQQGDSMNKFNFSPFISLKVESSLSPHLTLTNVSETFLNLLDILS